MTLLLHPTHPPLPPGGGTRLFWPVRYRVVPLDRVWLFDLAVLNKVCSFICFCPKQGLS